MPRDVELAAAIARRFEGLRLRPYLCPAGVPSIGYGSTHYEDGTPVHLGDAPITRERAESLLQRDLASGRRQVRRLCPRVADAGPLGALVDFVYNLGAGRLATSTLRRCVNAGDWHRVPGELRKWVMGGGRRLPGLVARRDAEVQLLQLPGETVND